MSVNHNDKEKVEKVVEQSKTSEPSGSTRLDVSVKGDKVVIRFAQPVTIMVLEAEQAAAMGEAMLATANAAINNRKVVIVPAR